MRWMILAIFAASAIYVHFRGRVRHAGFRQLSDHSTFMAPINCFAYLLSRVPTTPYVPVSRFPELTPLRESWRIIREEALAMREASRIRAADAYNDIGFNSFFRTGWKRFYLKWYDDAHPSAVEHCPRTTAILSAIPSVKAAMFAELPPGSKLMRHRDPFAGSLRYHLGLATPNDPACNIDVDGQPYFWRDGEDVIFDETYIHFAENQSGCDRIILFCDIERPMRFRWAQLVVRGIGRFLLGAATSPNDTGDRTGGLNHAFAYLYRVRLVGKRLKGWNRTVYYALKWSLFGGIAALIFLT